MRLTDEYCHQLTDGIFCVLKDMGIWEGEVTAPKDPIVSNDGEVGFINANAPGIFVPSVNHTRLVEEGEVVGHILSPLDGTVQEECKSPMKGMVFTLREYPVVACGSLIARILGGDFS